MNNRELDAQIAEKVMEKPWHGLDTLRYSASISGAWFVVEEMRERGFCMNIQTHLGPPVEYQMKLWDCDRLVAGEWCDTAPEAICRAALEAVK